MPAELHIVGTERHAVPMTEAEAQAATAKIKGYAGQLWLLLLEVHDRKGYKALGYSTFADYLRVEIDVSRSRGYQLLDQARVATAITAASGMSNALDITAREAQDLKPVLESVTAEVAERVAEGENPEVVIPEVIDAARHRQADTAKLAELTDALDEMVDDQKQVLEELVRSGDATPEQFAELAGSTFTTRSTEGQSLTPIRPAKGGVTPAGKGARQPLPDQLGTAAWNLQKAIDRLEKLSADDRYPKYRDEHVVRLARQAARLAALCDP